MPAAETRNDKRVCVSQSAYPICRFPEEIRCTWAAYESPPARRQSQRYQRGGATAGALVSTDSPPGPPPHTCYTPGIRPPRSGAAPPRAAPVKSKNAERSQSRPSPAESARCAAPPERAAPRPRSSATKVHRRIALARINPRVGDLERNACRARARTPRSMCLQRLIGQFRPVGGPCSLRTSARDEERRGRAACWHVRPLRGFWS
jgi:hypothetical protein